ncbi:MAG: hypothetical protein ABIF88_02455 [archaeon]
MEKIKDENELLGNLFLDVENSGKEKIVFLGGHFPLLYDKSGAVEAVKLWGVFSEYTLELACKVAEYAKKKSKKINFVFFVDDHMYEGMNQLSASQLSLIRNKLYKKRSGKNAKLLEFYGKILKRFGFSEKDVIRQNQNKKGREECLYFSEKKLRASKINIDNLCAREYIAFIEDKNCFSKKKDYLVAFIPQRCRENICVFALDNEIKGLSGSHVFLDTMAKTVSREKLYSFGNGVLYRKD